MKKKRRDIEGVSLSFLDVISCGFGSIILLLVLTKIVEPVVFEDTIENLQGYLAALQENLFNIRGETRDLKREMIRKEDLQVEEIKRLTELKIGLEALQDQYDIVVRKNKASDKIKGELATAKQTLTEEMKDILEGMDRDAQNNTIGGIPVDSEYVIFIIDTSGSMHTYAWPLLLHKVAETLEVYPRLKGIQVMNDMGKYMFSEYANTWIPDNAKQRNRILNRLETWTPYSNSSPVEGITKAISIFYKPGRKISLYVFGDDFQGRSVAQVVNSIDRSNRTDAEGNRLVRIHAVGFPVIFSQPPSYQASAIRFSILMRELCIRNGGTFVALNDFRLF